MEEFTSIINQYVKERSLFVTLEPTISVAENCENHLLSNFLKSEYGNILQRRGKLSKGRRYLFEALEWSRLNRDRKLEISTLKKIIVLSASLEDNEMMRSYNEELREVVAKYGSEKNLIELMVNQVVYLVRVDMFSDSIPYLEKGVALARKGKFYYLIIKILVGFSFVYKKMFRYDDATKYEIDALNLLTECSRDSLISNYEIDDLEREIFTTMENL